MDGFRIELYPGRKLGKPDPGIFAKPFSGNAEYGFDRSFMAGEDHAEICAADQSAGI